MSLSVNDIITKSTSAKNIKEREVLQELWSGYGVIRRYHLPGSEPDSLIVKHICLPDFRNHPRGWNTDISHKRKLRSYEVEKTWYRKWSGECSDRCRVPRVIAIQSSRNESVIVLEDLDSAGFHIRKRSMKVGEMEPCLSWLAYFHATYMGCSPENLWKIGTYWHLDTRPDELEALKDNKLKASAASIDRRLNECRYKTFVHGDAKLANFCFSKEGGVAAVDFQYVGGGCGMKDVAYFIGSCLSEAECEKYENSLLDCYFSHLSDAIRIRGCDISADEVEREWRKLFPFAWADFHRFIKGWSPGHWKINSYSEKITQQVLNQL